MTSAAQVEKEQGNTAFKAGKLATALEHYTKAMDLDPADVTFPLNRAMANLKLKRWAEAEKDASAALHLELDNLKAHWRRCTARKELGGFTGARQDLWAYFHAGGEPQHLVDENIKISRAEVEAMLVATRQSTSKFFKVKESPGKGLGAFAARSFQRGDLVFAEWPLYILSKDQAEQGMLEVMFRVSPSARTEFMSLHDSGTFPVPPEGDPIINNPQAAEMVKIRSIQDSNALGAGADKLVLGLRLARFNFSCAPNARYSWHDATRTMRLHALRTIEKGEEITFAFATQDDMYGKTRKERQERLKPYNFACLCAACTLPRPEQVGSDRRRKELLRLHDGLYVHREHIREPWQTKLKLFDVVKALRMMEEEGLAADTDDFTSMASQLCSFHSDWESVKYWATMTYETRAAQYGGDSQRALGELEPQMIDLLLSPRTTELAGKGQVQLFADARL